MNPMREKLSEIHIGHEEDALRLPSNLLNEEAIANARNDIRKNVNDILKEFENIGDDMMDDYEILYDQENTSDDNNNENSDESHYSDDESAKFFLVNEIKEECKRIYMKHSDNEAFDSDFLKLFENIIQLLKSEGNEAGLQGELFDTLGFEELNLITKLITSKAEIIKQYESQKIAVSTKNSKHSIQLMTADQIKAKVAENTRRAREQPLLKDQSITKYPHVFRTHDPGNIVSFTGKSYTLPMGSTRESFEKHEEVFIPKSEKRQSSAPNILIPVKELDFLCQGTFKNYKTLNRMQSLIYDVGYNTNENMLVCAPTGAGKTDVALLAILHTIKQFISESENFGDETVNIDVDYDEFKIVYVAPLKALAAEIVEKFSKKLAWLGIQVRELTGDMQLTKAEILTTQIIVTTPEKWDVVTRKSTGDTELVEKVKLLIIDEVHLLHEDRGSVIETLVARTLRQVESSQSMIRIVGLSATLPNFVDVADFLGVNRNVGMFFFDQSFRPVPLEQQLVGVKGKAGSKQARENLDEVSFEKVLEMIKQGHQIMVFVHSRKDTVKTARNYIKMIRDQAYEQYFDCKDTEKYNYFEKEMTKNKNKDARELFVGGFGIHHAGMSRSDRNMTEKMFLNGAIKVLVCTATLAWGVNLPAAAVIIKGTQVYDSKQGGFVDLGISDVIQIFGRAGRPQFEAHGIGILCTTSDRLDHYISLLLQQHPIESKLSAKLVDNLNAEISLGTVTNVEEGVQWLGYTYLYVRMKQNPFAYGIDWQELAQDPLLVQRRRDMIIDAARKLHKLQMIVFDERSSAFIPKDIGRISSDFYLLNESVEVFNQMITSQATEADVLSIISMSSEFDNVKFREEEAKELDELQTEKIVCEIGPKLESSQKKTNVLLQSYISKAFVKDSALSSDMAYIAQNAARICRSLFFMGLNRRWGVFTRHMLEICKAVDKQLWPFQHPMNQFQLQPQIIKLIDSKKPTMEHLRDMEPAELGDLVHNKSMGPKLHKLIGRFPYLLIDVECFPITKNVMRIHATIEPDFIWNFECHGNTQFFWILVEDSDTSNILHFEKFILNKKSFSSPHEIAFMIPLSDPPPPQIIFRAISDVWLGSETSVAVSFKHLIKPHNDTVKTQLLKLHPLPVTAIHNEEIEKIYKAKFSYFNPMQTMIFHTLYNTNSSVFVGSPTGSGKTVVAELAIWHAFNEFPNSKIVYIAPMKALVRERVDDWRVRICANTTHKIVELTGDSLPGVKEVREADIIITTPEKFDGISRNWQTRKFVQQISLVIMDEIHLLASDRGPILEMIVSRMNYISSFTKKPIRLLGLSTAVSNAMDMASWLGVKEGLFNFPQSVRPVPLKMYIDGFPDNLAFCPLMKTMNKPAFMAIKQHSPTKPVLIFVASRRQTRLTALDIIHLCGMEDNPRRFLKMNEDELSPYIEKVKDDTLKLSLQFGIGLHHAGLVESDRQISHKLFEQNKIQILIATSTLAWGVNLPAHLVIIKGTQFFDAKIEGYRDMDLTDILQMMGRAGRPAFDTSGTAMVFTKESKKAFYKHFLNVGFPVESSLHKVMDNHIGAEISSGTIKTRQDAMDFLTWTFLYRRAHHNPTYYGIEDVSQDGISTYLSGLIDKVIENLIESKCLISTGDKLNATPFLQISSYYYLSHKTIRNLVNKIVPNASFRQCLRWLCEATEYDELPTRHGEELINMEMSQEMRYPADDLEDYEFIWDPHIKAFLLLQAFMTRIELPIADYAQDTVSVLDQSLRILQSYIDATSEMRFLSTTLNFIKVMQCIKQGCWFDDDFVFTLPGLKMQKLENHEECFDNDGSEWKSSLADPKITLKELSKISKKNKNSIYQIMDKLHVSRNKRDEFIKVISTLPTGKFQILEQKNVGELEIELIHDNLMYRKDYRIYAPKFSKPQRETWFVILCDISKDELYVIKRESPKKAGNNVDKVSCKLNVPSNIYGEEIDVIMISDFTNMYYQGKYRLQR
jgi:antiviral helicase SLH1